MKPFSTITGIALTALLFCAVSGYADNVQPEKTEGKAGAGEPQIPEEKIILDVPIFSPLFSDIAVATVNEEPITLKELTEFLARSHEEATGEKAAGKKDYCEILKRIINTRLIANETRNMGFDRLPEFKEAVRSYSQTLLRDMLRERHTKDVKADKSEVEKIYKKKVKEYKIASIFFKDEKPAKKMEEEVKAGKDFHEAAKKFIESKEAGGEPEGKFIKAGDLQSEVEKVVSAMKIGSVSPVIKVESGYTILKLEDVSYPDDPKVKEEAEQEALDMERANAFRKYLIGLVKTHVLVDKRVFDSIDYEAEKPGFEKLLKDKRVVVTIKGGKPVTVAELSAAIKSKFFHGIEQAIKDKKVNEQRFPAIEEVVQKRVLEIEATRQGINKTKDYKDRLKDYENSLLFGLFIQKVVSPEVKVEDSELETYYEKHKAEYASLQKMKLSSLAFAKKKAAEDAAEKLKKGADFKWVRANAVDQAAGAATFDGASIFTSELPEAGRKAVEGAKSGDVKIYVGAEGYYYVLYLQEIISGAAPAFDSVKGMIYKIVLNEKMTKDIEEWANKLKEPYKVRVYLGSCEKM